MGQCVIMTGGYAGDSSDDCTATKSQVLEGYKAITKDSDDDAELGIMPNKGAWTNRIGVNGKAIIPAGYHNGSGYVDQAIANKGTWGTSIGINGNITIPEGFHNGQGHVTQSIATMGGQTITPSANQQTVSCSGKYMTGNVIISPSYYYIRTQVSIVMPEQDKTLRVYTNITPPNMLEGKGCAVMVSISNIGTMTAFLNVPTSSQSTNNTASSYISSGISGSVYATNKKNGTNNSPVLILSTIRNLKGIFVGTTQTATITAYSFSFSL